MIADEQQARAFCAQRVGAEGMERLEAYIGRLEEENQRQNLVSSASLAHVWQRHIADSLQLLDLADVSPETSMVDLGSGAGLPGIPIAIARPETEVVLVESRSGRAQWLQAIAQELDLASIRVEARRLEKVRTFAAGVITARAFAPLGRLLALSTRFSTPQTVWLLPKGRSAAQELAQQPAGVRAMFHVKQSVTDPEAGLLVGRGRPSIA